MSEQDLITSEDFAAYRKREIAIGVKIIADMFTDSMKPEYIKGAIDLLKKILYLPKEMAKTEEVKEMADMIVERDLKAFEIKFLRIFVE